MYLSEKEAVKKYGMSRTTLHRLRIEGSQIGKKLPYRKLRGTILYKPEEIEEFIEQHKV